MLYYNPNFEKYPGFLFIYDSSAINANFALFIYAEIYRKPEAMEKFWLCDSALLDN